jgi:hypothetical protein
MIGKKISGIHVQWHGIKTTMLRSKKLKKMISFRMTNIPIRAKSIPFRDKCGLTV